MSRLAGHLAAGAEEVGRLASQGQKRGDPGMYTF